jgi:hypothetical protein
VSYNKNLNIGQNNVVNISGSLITVTGSLYGSEISGTTARFIAVSASSVSASHITGADLRIDYIDFNSALIEPTFQTGRIHYDLATSDLIYDTNVSGVTINIGQQTVVRAKNTSGSPITKGKFVRITGGSGSFPVIGLADWSAEVGSANTIGAVMENVADNGFTYVLLNGVLSGVNTDNVIYNDGDLLYLSSSGDFTKTSPLPPKHTVRLGQVLRAHHVQGTIFVKVDNGYELGELHDVYTSSVSNGDLLVYNSSLTAWNNSKILSGSYIVSGNLTVIGTISASNYQGVSGSGGGSTLPGGSDKSVQFNSGSTFSGSSELVWDYVNNRFGVGTETPTEKLHVKNSGSVYSLVENIANTGYTSVQVKNDSGSYVQLISVASTQTGVWFGGDNTPLDRKNTVGFRTGGSETALVFAAQGNVPLHIGQNDTTRLLFNNSEVSFNHNKLNYNFRIAGDNDDNILFVSASTDRIGIGTSTPNAKLDVNGNTIVSGNLTVTGSITELSTRRIKTNIESLNNELITISKLNPVSYTRIDDGRKEYGFISEEVKEVYPEFVVGEGINYPKMVSILVSAVKELTHKIEKQQNEIELLKNNKKKSTRGKK